MAKVKYRVREYTPTENQSGSHSFYAEAVVTNEISNDELAERIARRTGTKSYEAQMVVAAIAEIVMEEVLESHRVNLCDEKGTKMLSIYPKVSGAISDKDVKANPEKYNNAQVATEEMLTSDLMSWTLGSTVGIKFSKKFAIDKQAQKVNFVATDIAIPNDDVEDDNNNNQNPGGGDNNGGGFDTGS